jgi:protein SCO1/2
MAAFAPFLMRAFHNIRYHDEPVSFDHYGEYAIAATDVTPLRELLATMAWLGPAAREVLPELKALTSDRGRFSAKMLRELERTMGTIADAAPPMNPGADTCCSLPAFFGNTLSWAPGFRCSCETIESTVFEDQEGARLTFAEFFRGHPSVVVFFYTRCDNPQKCSLTIAKLARIQGLLSERGLTDRIRTAAITYDPAFDGPERIRGYGKSRSVQFGAGHRMLRPIDGIGALRTHFKLGVNFVESLVNRHRIEVYLLDAAGAIAGSYERIHWQEQEVVDRVAELLKEQRLIKPANVAAAAKRAAPALPVSGVLASIAFAFFPKCPFCWAAYLSVFGVAGLEQIPYSPWLQPVFVVLMLLNLFSVWVRGRTTRRMSAFGLVAAGAMAIVLSRSLPNMTTAVGWSGVALTLAGSFLSAAQNPRKRNLPFLRRLAAPPAQATQS